MIMSSAEGPFNTREVSKVTGGDEVPRLEDDELESRIHDCLGLGMAGGDYEMSDVEKSGPSALKPPVPSDTDSDMAGTEKVDSEWAGAPFSVTKPLSITSSASSGSF